MSLDLVVAWFFVLALTWLLASLAAVWLQWLATVAHGWEVQPESGDSFEIVSPWLPMLPEFGGGPGRGRQIQVERIQNISGGGISIAEDSEAARVAIHRMLGEAGAVREPPTSACSRCDRVLPVADLYTGQKSGRQVCEGCLTAMVAMGTARRPAGF